MGPGTPGIALGGLFYLLLALIGPVVEAVRALRGRSTAASRRLVARHFTLAVIMVIALDLTYRAAALLFEQAPAEGAVALPTTPVLLGLALLGLVLAATKLVGWGLGQSAARRTNRRRPTGTYAFQGGRD